MNVVKLETRHGPRVTHQASVHLAAAQVPQADQAVGCATRQGRVEALHGADEIGRRVGQTARRPPLALGAQGGRLRRGPQHIQRLHAASADQIPLAQRLVRRPGDQGVAAEVQRRHLVHVGVQGEHETVLQRGGGRGALPLVLVAAFADVAVAGHGARAAEIPQFDGCIHRPGRDDIVFDLETPDRRVVAFEEASAATHVEVPHPDGVVEGGGDHGAEGVVEIKRSDHIGVGLDFLDL